MNPPVYLELTGRLVVVIQDGRRAAPALFLTKGPASTFTESGDMRDLLAVVNPGAALGTDPTAIDVADEILAAFEGDAESARGLPNQIDLGLVRIVVMTKPDDGADVWTIVDGAE